MRSGKFRRTRQGKRIRTEVRNTLQAIRSTLNHPGPWIPLLLALAICGRSDAQSDLPDAPAPQEELAIVTDPGNSVAPPLVLALGQQTFPPQATRQRGLTLPGLQPTYVPLPRLCIANSCTATPPPRSCCQQNADLFGNYLKQNAIHIYTPGELGRLAIRGVIDPFNLLTIGATSAYSVATDAHSPYGPGLIGVGKLSGVAITQQMTGEFFGTFLIPSVDHQNPHYRRMPNAPLRRRIIHCVAQIFWTDSDTGQGMVNYSTILGTVADEVVGIAYVPYQQVGWGASAARIGTAWATDPIGNFITEFVPDVARHINVNIVLVQRIINRVALEEGAGSP